MVHLSSWSFHFVPCFPPFLGALVNLWLVGFHLVGAFSIDPKNKSSSKDISFLHAFNTLGIVQFIECVDICMF